MKHTQISWLKNLILCCILFLLTWICYANTLGNKFAFDDKSLIVDNKLLHEGTSLKEIFTTNYRHGVGFQTEGIYRPLVILSYVINNHDFNPFPFHFFNITLNALISPLLFLLVFSLFGNHLIAVFTAVLFALHPLHTEAVANIIGRSEIMCTFFILLSWIVFEKSPKYLWLQLIGSLFFFSALLSKETAVVLPLMIISTDIVLGKHLIQKQMIMKYSLIFVTLLIYLIVRWSVLAETVAGLNPDFISNPIAHSPVIERIATAFSVFLHYCILLLFPFKLSSDYSYAQIPIYSTFLHFIPLIAVLLFIVIFVISIFVRKKHPVFGIALLLFFYPYILISNIFYPIGTIMGERLMFLPSVGFSLAGGYILVKIMEKQRIISVIFTILILTFYCMKTVSRNRDWYDDYTLFKADSITAPNSVKILYNMGFLSGQKGMYLTGENYFRKALEIYPEFDRALRGLGKSLYDQKRYEESAVHYAQAVQISAEESSAHYDYGCVLEKIGQFDEAEKEYLEAIKLSPTNPLYYQGVGNLMISKENFIEALTYLEHALKLGGNKQIILNNMAVASFFKEDYKEAYNYVKQAEFLGIQINPELVKSIKNKIRD